MTGFDKDKCSFQHGGQIGDDVMMMTTGLMPMTMTMTMTMVMMAMTMTPTGLVSGMRGGG